MIVIWTLNDTELIKVETFQIKKNCGVTTASSGKTSEL